MTPVDQCYMNDPEADVHGDCFRACVASILEVKPEAVPHFILHGSRWFRIATSFLYHLDREIEWNQGEIKGMPLDTWVIATVHSPRREGTLHSVIMRNGKMVHDPHPSRAYGQYAGDWYTITPDSPSPFRYSGD